jgi:hypothetical protein
MAFTIAYTFGGLLITPIANSMINRLRLIKKSNFENPINTITVPETQIPRKTIAAMRKRSAKVIIAVLL